MKLIVENCLVMQALLLTLEIRLDQLVQNGAGKTTLLKIINGDIQPTSGDIISSGEEIGILPQNLNKWLDKTVYDLQKR